MMDHSNIAHALDAGTANDGRPYFVMELVDGTPITQYCDDNTLRKDLTRPKGISSMQSISAWGCVRETELPGGENLCGPTTSIPRPAVL